MLYAFCGHDELWRDHCLDAVGRGGHLNWASEGTWRATYVRSFASEGTRCPSLSKTKARVYSDFLYHGFVVASTQLQSAWLARETMQRVDARGLTAEEFSRRFEQKSRPVILEGCVETWPAMRSWSQASLLQRCGDVVFQCGPCDLPLRQFYAYVDRNVDDVPLFVFDKYFGTTVPDLLQDYEVPAVFRGRDLFNLLGEERPDYRWLLIGNKRSGSKWHIDPNKTSAWNAVVKGRKRWLLLPPGCTPPGVHPSDDGGDVTQPVSLIEWFMNFYGELRKMADGNAAFDIQEGTCGPGDAVFIPCGWWHCVLNLEDDTIAVTQNYASEAQVHSVRRFLREKRDQVSGVPAERKPLLADLFDAALARSRPDLLVAPESEAAAGCAAGACSAFCEAEATEGFSFWDHLRSTGRNLAFGAATDAAADTAGPNNEAQGLDEEPAGPADLAGADWLAALGSGESHHEELEEPAAKKTKM